MVRGYLNVRATGGAVASSPYRGRPWRGWMLLCFFLRAEESKEFAGQSPASRRSLDYARDDKIRGSFEPPFVIACRKRLA